MSNVASRHALEYSADEKPAYAFCESVHATGRSRWHIRKLDDAGLKLGGGITTPSLCSHIDRGWDLSVRIRPEMLGGNQEVACKECLAAYKRETNT